MNQEKNNAMIKLDKDSFVARDKEPFLEHLNLATEINTGGGRPYYGIYLGLNKRNELVLCPTLVAEIHSCEGEKDERTRPIYSWIDRPTFVNYQGTAAVGPVRKEYLDMLVKGEILLVSPRRV